MDAQDASGAEQAVALVHEELFARVAAAARERELEELARHQAVEDSVCAALDHLQAAYLPLEAPPADVHLHASWLPVAEPDAPPPDPWIRGALRVIVKQAATVEDDLPESPVRTGKCLAGILNFSHLPAPPCHMQRDIASSLLGVQVCVRL
jgi:hypothetical protein